MSSVSRMVKAGISLSCRGSLPGVPSRGVRADGDRGDRAEPGVRADGVCAGEMAGRLLVLSRLAARAAASSLETLDMFCSGWLAGWVTLVGSLSLPQKKGLPATKKNESKKVKVHAG